MLFRKSYNMPCRKLIPPFTFTHKKTPLSVLRMRFSFLYISQPFSSYQRREMTSFTVVWTTQALDQNIFNFSFLTWNRSWQFNPGRKVSKHFASQTTWRNYYRKSTSSTSERIKSWDASWSLTSLTYYKCLWQINDNCTYTEVVWK